MPSNLMLVPSSGCPARCDYCFGRAAGTEPMSVEALAAALHWAQSWRGGAPEAEVIFHGGEALLPGAGWYAQALPLLRSTFGPRLRLSVQSNLWLLDDALCDLFAEHGVSIGTSLDGPGVLNDSQRGVGHFARTTAGIALARRHGLGVGCICTFTRQSAPRALEILDFFTEAGMSFSIHAAVPPLANVRDADWVLPPKEYGDLLVTLLDAYLQRLHRIRIPSLDGLCRSVSAEQGSVCAFGDCLGGYLAVGPDGGIYPCQRFVGLAQYCLGNVAQQPGWDELAATPVWKALREREESMRAECGACPHFAYCRGGCPYDALAAGGGVFRQMRDPYCPAYRRIFDHITDRALQEVLSDENLAAVVEEPNGDGLLRKGKLLGLMRGDPHPTEVRQHARQLLLSVALGGNERHETTAERLVQAGVARSAEAAALALQRMAKRILAPVRLNNLYLHVTFGCNLSCDHCYASAGPDGVRGPMLRSEQALSLCRQSAVIGFRRAVITGGEPLVHPERDALLGGLADLRSQVKPLLIALRTNLAAPLRADLADRIAEAVDEVFVSIDGGEAEHDARRGAGTYVQTVANLRTLLDAEGPAEVGLTAIMPESEAAGPRGSAVLGLARELGIRRVHFRPLLPLGRAGGTALELVPEAHGAYLGAGEAAAYGMTPTASCGIGQNVYIGPTGEAFPCYACCDRDWLLGNVSGEAGLAGVVESARFRDLATHTVDTSLRCCDCAVRYLCGGLCRAWTGTPTADLDAPVNCGGRLGRAVQLTRAALAHLGVPVERWEAVGLPPLGMGT